MFNGDRFGTNFSEIILTFNNSGQALLKDFRIDIKMLLDLIRQLDERCSIKFVRTIGGGNYEKWSEEASVTWGSVQRALFLLLSDILKDMPHKAEGPIPQIWIDGCGKVLRAKFPATTTSAEQAIEYRHTSLNEKEVRNLGYKKISNFERAIEEGPTTADFEFLASYFYSLWGSHRLTNTNSLAETWIALWDSLWCDWHLVTHPMRGAMHDD